MRQHMWVIVAQDQKLLQLVWKERATHFRKSTHNPTWSWFLETPIFLVNVKHGGAHRVLFIPARAWMSEWKGFFVLAYRIGMRQTEQHKYSIVCLCGVAGLQTKALEYWRSTFVEMLVRSTEGSLPPSSQLAFIFLELKQKRTLNAHTWDRKVTCQVTNKQSILRTFTKMRTYSEPPSSPCIHPQLKQCPW